MWSCCVRRGCVRCGEARRRDVERGGQRVSKRQREEKKSRRPDTARPAGGLRARASAYRAHPPWFDVRAGACGRVEMGRKDAEGAESSRDGGMERGWQAAAHCQWVWVGGGASGLPASPPAPGSGRSRSSQAGRQARTVHAQPARRALSLLPPAQLQREPRPHLSSSPPHSLQPSQPAPSLENSSGPKSTLRPVWIDSGYIPGGNPV